MSMRADSEVANAIENLTNAFDETSFRVLLEASDSGDSTAASVAGRVFENGESGEVDLENAKKYYIRAVEGGDSIAAFNLGILYFDSEAYSDAMKMFQVAYERGELDSAFFMSKMLEEGRLGDRNLEEAFRCLSDASSKGSCEAIVQLSRFYGEGKFIAVDRKRRDGLLEEAMKIGCPSSFYEKGRVIVAEATCNTDRDYGFGFIAEAAERGLVVAMEWYGEEFCLARAGVGEDFSRGHRFLEKAVEMGSSRAMFLLAIVAMHDAHSLKDLDYAAELCSVAAKLGEPGAGDLMLEVEQRKNRRIETGQR